MRISGLKQRKSFSAKQISDIRDYNIFGDFNPRRLKYREDHLPGVSTPGD